MLRSSPLVSPANHRLYFLSSPSLSPTSRSQPSNSLTNTRFHRIPLAISVNSGVSPSHSVSSHVDSKGVDRSDGFKEGIDVGKGERIEVANGCDKLGMMKIGVGSPSLIGVSKMSLGDQAFFLMSFIAITTTVAFTSLVAAAIPTLFAMKRAAISLAKLSDIAREELPSTMAAVRLSGMEISDLTLELSDLSQEISQGVNKSAQAVKAAEAGVKQMGAIAHQKTMSIIEERANLPDISIPPFVAGAARKTTRVVGQATKNIMDYFMSGEGESSKTGKKPNVGSIET
ncbi:hypothetical protein LUZ60_007973 [Juncus effusus]|nr:hypothetical protein LUZ60_007973 [Juncus effusus]